MRKLLPGLGLFVVLGWALFLTNDSAGQNQGAAKLVAPAIDRAFWAHWGDGKAEVAGYDLKFPRYGEIRSGRAVTIFCTESFSDKKRVKSDISSGRDVFPVMKLNLVQDYSTGIYDYNQLLSSFVTLAPRHGYSAGFPTKVSFSCQEWCGHVYHQLLFDSKKIRSDSHSYFDGEADDTRALKRPEQTTSEDVLFHWARGFAAPVLKPGETIKASLVNSLEYSRLRHQPVTVQTAVFSQDAQTQRIKVPAGDFEVMVRKVKVGENRVWTFFVATAAPHRIIKWQSSVGHEGQLLKSTRIKYWQMHGEAFAKAVEKLGLSPRKKRSM